MLRHWSFILANTLRNRRRSVLTLTSVAVSLCLLSVLGAMYRALFLEPDLTPSQALRIATHQRVSITQPMPISFLSKIRSVPGVRDSMVWQWFGGTYKDARDPRNFFARFAVEPGHFFKIKDDVSLSEDQKRAFERTRSGCLVGKKLAERFGWRIGDSVSLTGDIFPVTLELKIVGIFTNREPDSEDTLFFDYEYLRQLLNAAGESSRADAVGVFLTEVDRPENVDSVSAAIDKQFETSSAPTKSESERAWQLSFISFLGDLKLFLLTISGALTFTVLLVSGNTMSMAIRERTREIGVLRTLGFSRGAILGILMGESLCLALTGACAGILLAVVCAASIQRSGSPFAALRLGISYEVAIFVFLFAAVIGILSSVLSAWRAAHLNILESLKYMG